MKLKRNNYRGRIMNESYIDDAERLHVECDDALDSLEFSIKDLNNYVDYLNKAIRYIKSSDMTISAIRGVAFANSGFGRAERAIESIEFLEDLLNIIKDNVVLVDKANNILIDATNGIKDFVD